jgi:hypothetical protein
VSSTPPLSSNNRFVVLSVEEVHKSDSISSTDDIVSDLEAVLKPPRPCSRFRTHPKWEKRLPKHYIVASNPSANSFKLDVSMQTINMGMVLASKALLNSGATISSSTRNS